MKIEFKNVRLSSFTSRETTCFQATLYINGQRAAAVGNDGRGGCNFYHFDNPILAQQFQAYCKSRPPVRHSDHGLVIKDTDFVIDELLDEWEAEKQFKRQGESHTIFRLRTDKPGKYRMLRGPFSRLVRDRLYVKYGDKVESILNDTLVLTV